MAKIRNSRELLEALKAEYKRRGLKEPNIELMNPTEEELNTYTVVFVPRRPQPRGGAPKV